MNTTDNAILNDSLGSITLGDKTLLVSQPTRADLFSFWRHCRDLAKNKRGLKKELEELKEFPDEVRKPLTTALVNKYSVEPSASAIWDKTASPEGVAFLVFLLTRNNNAVTAEEIISLVNINNVDNLIIDLEEASGMRIVTENIKLDVKKNPTTN